MKRKSPQRKHSTNPAVPPANLAIRNWRRASDATLRNYAISFHEAAKLLASAYDAHADPSAGFGPCAVVSMYRQALEFVLKALVIGGAGFLEHPPDRHSVMKTRSISWLAQSVCQIATQINIAQHGIVVGTLTPYFRCEGMESMDDFNAIVNDLNLLDTSSKLLLAPPLAPATFLPAFSVREFAERLDPILDRLLAIDCLVEGWASMEKSTTAENRLQSDPDFRPTIQ